MAGFSLQDFFDRIETEPCVLFIGQDFDVHAPENRNLLQLGWSTIITSQRGDDFASAFSMEHDRRLAHDLYDVIEINDRIFDKHNLSVVHLFSTESVSHHSAEYVYGRKEQSSAANIFRRITDMLQISGTLVVVGYSDNDRFSFDRFLDICDSFRSGGILVFGCHINEGQQKREFEDIATHNHILLETQSLPALLFNTARDMEEDPLFPPEADYEHFYINGNLERIGSKDLNHIRQVADPLTLEVVQEVEVPSYLVSSYFYLFLKNSPSQPQWYGYKQQFNLRRDYENKLYEKVKTRLDAPGSDMEKIICLTSQSGAGKSIALAYLAYRVFMERQYPVLFLQNKDVSLVFDRDTEQIRGMKQIERYLEILKDKGAKSILFVLDVSAFGKISRASCCRLFEILAGQKGYNIVLVFSSYEIVEDDRGRREKRNYIEMEADPRIHPGLEEESFRKILRQKAGFSQDQIDRVMSVMHNERDENGQEACKLMSLLYRAVYDVRPAFEGGIRREATTSIDEILKMAGKEAAPRLIYSDIAMALKHAYENSKDKEKHKDIKPYMDKVGSDGIEIKEDVENLLASVALCSKYGLPVPANLAYRLLPSVSYKYVQMIFHLPFFVFHSFDDGDFEFWIRTREEAEMLLRAFNIDEEGEVGLLKQMIENLNATTSYSHTSEVELMVKMLVRLGPNSLTWSDKRLSFEYYPKIIGALQSLREKHAGHPRLTLQEIVYTREYVVHQFDNQMEDDEIMSLEKLVITLRNAIRIGEEELLRLMKEHDSANFFLCDALTIEINTSRLKIFQHTKVRNMKEFIRMAKECLGVIQHSPDNSYAYTTLFQTALLMCDSDDSNDIDKTNILANCGEMIVRLRGEHEEIAQQAQVLDASDKLLAKLGRVDLNDKYFQSLLQHGSGAGVYIRTYRMLEKNGIELYRKGNTLSEEQVTICQQACDYLTKKEYAKVVSDSVACQQLLLRLKWMILDGEPIFSRPRQYTYISSEGWEELLAICRHYRDYLYDEEDNYYNANTMLYVLALCYAQLGKFADSLKVCDIIRNKTEDLYFENRVRVLHILCDPTGKPIEFLGSFIRTTNPEAPKGFVRIDEISPAAIPWMQGNNNAGIYYHQANLSGDTRREPGWHYPDFQLGLGYMGLSVFRGLENNNIRRAKK